VRKAGELEKRALLARVADGERDLLRAVGVRYAQASLESFRTDGHAAKLAVVQSLVELADSMAARVAAGENLILFGPSGGGKDHLVIAMLRLAIRSGHSVCWVNGMDLYGQMRDRIGGDTTEADVIAKLSRPEILAISDPLPEGGALSAYQQQSMFRIVDRRYRDMRPTWVTVNTAGGAEFADRSGQAIHDRLRHGALCLACNWPSYRRPRGAT
jgi:DNA replication protein DnaC